VVGAGGGEENQTTRCGRTYAAAELRSIEC
jgi:hypothetical protein